jgi:hypothetical protein
VRISWADSRVRTSPRVPTSARLWRPWLPGSTPSRRRNDSLRCLLMCPLLARLGRAPTCVDGPRSEQRTRGGATAFASHRMPFLILSICARRILHRRRLRREGCRLKIMAFGDGLRKTVADFTGLIRPHLGSHESLVSNDSLRRCLEQLANGASSTQYLILPRRFRQ